ncbi:MAG: pseudaminic acid synthase [Bacteriovoracaceae bacterium]
MKIQIGKDYLGEQQPCFIVAEMSGNHGGSIKKALEIVKAAKDAGADAVKLQTYTPDSITLNSPKDDFKIPGGNPWSEDKYLYNLYEKAQTPVEWHQEIFDYAKEIGITIFSSPFDFKAVELLHSLNAPAYKLASPEITDIPLIKLIASKGKPVIISTGMSEEKDIELAVETIRKTGNNQIIILKCTSSYPALPESLNLRTIPDIAKRFNCLSGLSDHSMGIEAPVAAVVLGASFIEKHFVMDKTDNSVDAFFSLDQAEFKIMVQAVRTVEKMLGKISYEPTEDVGKNFWARRSLYISQNVKAGETLTAENVRSVRPSHGLHPKHYEEVLGKKAKKDLTLGDRLTWDVIS